MGKNHHLTSVSTPSQKTTAQKFNVENPISDDEFARLKLQVLLVRLLPLLFSTPQRQHLSACDSVR